MVEYLDQHARIINFFINILTLTLIPLILFFCRRWFAGVMTADKCSSKMQELEKDRERAVTTTFMPKEDIKDFIREIKCDIEKVDVNINGLRSEFTGQMGYLNDAFIRHINSNK